MYDIGYSVIHVKSCSWLPDRSGLPHAWWQAFKGAWFRACLWAALETSTGKLLAWIVTAVSAWRHTVTALVSYCLLQCSSIRFAFSWDKAEGDHQGNSDSISSIRSRLTESSIFRKYSFMRRLFTHQFRRRTELQEEWVSGNRMIWSHEREADCVDTAGQWSWLTCEQAMTENLFDAC